MRRAPRTAALVVAAILAAGCAGDNRVGSSVSEADSAGVRIVTNQPGSIEAAEAWSIADSPVVAIGGGVDPEVPFSRISAVVPLSGNRVAVAANGPTHVQLFNADGTPGATLGRAGPGPGEFADATSLVPLGDDTLAVWDQNRRRISVFTVDGRFAREVDLGGIAPLSPMAAPSDRTVSAFTRLLPSTPGTLVLFGVGVFGPGLGVRRVEVPAYHITAGGEEIARLGPFPGEETFNFGAGRGGTVPYPFSASTYGAWAGEGLVVGTADAPEFRIYGRDGALARIVRWPDTDRAVGGAFLADWTEFVDGWLGTMPDGERSAVRELLDAIPQRERFPAYEGLIAGDAGEVWVAEYAGEHTLVYPPRNAPPPPRRWLVFGPDGALRATVRTPAGFEPHAVRAGRLWGVFRDSLEVESVRAYEISKG